MLQLVQDVHDIYAVCKNAFDGGAMIAREAINNRDITDGPNRILEVGFRTMCISAVGCMT